MRIQSLDHLVLTVESIAETVGFYTRILGMEEEIFTGGGVKRVALRFGAQKINLHEVGKEFSPRAEKPVAGSGDLCFLTDVAINRVISHLEKQSVTIIEGPVERTGARGKLLSVYLRDPDGNLIEVSNQADQISSE